MATQRGSAQTNRQRGFTLMELMIVIVIMGLIAAAVAVNVMDVNGHAHGDLARLDMRTIGNAVDVYRVRHDKLPDSIATLVADRELKLLPLDPWPPYLYERASDAAEGYRISTLGADGAPGGEGENADLHSDDPERAAQR